VVPTKYHHCPIGGLFKHDLQHWGSIDHRNATHGSAWILHVRPVQKNHIDNPAAQQTPKMQTTNPDYSELIVVTEPAKQAVA
jgi:hypothetical protein